MTSLKILLTASILALSAGASLADGYGGTNTQGGVGGSQILNSQINLQTDWSNLNASVDTVGGVVVAHGAAAGNLIDITTMNDTRVQNKQIVGPNADVGSNVNLNANNVWGNVGIQNQVVCNGASVSTDPILTSVKNSQECQAGDPYARVNANISNVAGNAVIQNSALGNSLEADSNAPNMPIITHQLNNSGVVSNVNANVFNTGGSVGLTSSAVGNTAQIIHYSTN
jgi:hypothetical protein